MITSSYTVIKTAKVDETASFLRATSGSKGP